MYVRLGGYAPMQPFLWMAPGMMPILHSSGLMIPGQLGPMSRVLFCCFRYHFTCLFVCLLVGPVVCLVHQDEITHNERAASQNSTL